MPSSSCRSSKGGGSAQAARHNLLVSVDKELQCRSSRGQPDGAAQGMLHRDHRISSCLTPATHKLLVFWFSSALSGPPSAFRTPALPELPASLPIWVEEAEES